MIRQHATEWHYRRHNQMGQRPHEAGFLHLEAELVLEERWLEQHQQIEVPGATEVGHNDGVHRHGTHHLPPGRCLQWRHRGMSGLAQRLLNVLELWNANRRMLARVLEAQPNPEHVPNDAEHSVGIEWRLIPDGIGQESGEGQSHHHAGIGAGKGQGG